MTAQFTTATYRHHGLEFSYPENWSLDESSEEQLPHEICLESPQGSIWNLLLYPPESNAQVLADEVLRELVQQSQGEALEYDRVQEKMAGIDLDGYDARYFCMHLLVEARVRFFQTDSFTFIVWFQAEDREFDRQGLVFSAITTSLLRNIQAPDEPI